MTSTKMVKERVEYYIDMYDFEGKVGDIIDNLTKISDKYGDNVEVQWRYDYDDVRYPALIKRRPENEYEIAARLAQERKHEEIRRAQYEKLKKEFEGEQS